MDSMNWNLKTIVVGIDGSDGSDRAAEHGVAIARHWQAQLLLVIKQIQGFGPHDDLEAVADDAVCTVLPQRVVV